ncbi:alpha/beta fold hydrolase [Paraglaciecola sp.]|uniref:alpha/beta hydrolase family protein n=1 Tax=Paraglaciecola sp. TaxID=1920173 RepID=UPI0030F3A297
MPWNAKSLCFLSLLFYVDIGFAKELPITSFSQLPSISNPNLSPNGQQIAQIENYLEPELSVLSTLNLATGEKKYLVKSDNEKVKINWFTWANEKTLIVSVRFASKIRTVSFTETRLLAIDIDGKEVEQRNLIRPKDSRDSKHISQFQDNVISFLPDDPEHILVAIDLDKANLPSVYKLNVNNKKLQRLEKGKMEVRDWMADRQGNLRLGEALDYDSGEASIRYTNLGDDTWHKMFEHNALEEPGVKPLGFAKDPNILYYRAYQDDKLALYKMELKSQQSTLVFADPDYDVDGSLIYSRQSNDVIGIRHANAKGGRIYWDENFSDFQKALDTAMPDTSNYLVDFSDDENTYLLYSENDSTPGAYFLGDRKEKSLSVLFEQYPLLLPDVLSSHKLVTYTTRDGTKIEGYLSLPPNTSGPIATILHPHGGPGAREYDGFDYWTSFFNNRGYAVFRPNFRGSSGYGKQFADSQMKGWGLTMQDDLTDAAQWLVAEKITDPQRMCIVGASYGGYAAAMAAVKTPDLFKCAISFAGVMDLEDIVSKSRHFLNKKFIRKQLGEDDDDLEARSPYYQANKIKIPILLLHGEKDRVVDVRQSREMADELADLGKDVTYVELENGDHYLSIQRNRHRVFQEMETFLKKHLATTSL